MTDEEKERMKTILEMGLQLNKKKAKKKFTNKKYRNNEVGDYLYPDEEAIGEIEKLLNKYEKSDPYKFVEEHDYSLVYEDSGEKT